MFIQTVFPESGKVASVYPTINAEPFREGSIVSWADFKNTFPFKNNYLVNNESCSTRCPFVNFFTLLEPILTKKLDCWTYLKDFLVFLISRKFISASSGINLRKDTVLFHYLRFFEGVDTTGVTVQRFLRINMPTIPSIPKLVLGLSKRGYGFKVTFNSRAYATV